MVWARDYCTPNALSFSGSIILHTDVLLEVTTAKEEFYETWDRIRSDIIKVIIPLAIVMGVGCLHVRDILYCP